MKTLIILCISLFVISAVQSCSHNNSRIESQFGSKLIMVDTLQKYQLGQNEISINQKKSKIKIATYIDGTCTQCVYELENWQKFIENELPKNVEVLIYLRVQNLKSLKKLLLMVNFPYPVLVDYNMSFISFNNISSNKIEQTFLLDKDNKVLAIGNPLYDNRIKKIYLSKIIDL